jgi:uncharacterized protein (DUF302 family)
MLSDATIKFSLPQPFERSVQLICASLRGHGIRVAGELDISRRLAGSLGIVIQPCKLLFVLPNPAALAAETVHPWAAVFLPLHIVISGTDCRAEIRIPNMVQAGRSSSAGKLYGPVVDAQRQLVDSIQAIAVRPSPLA